MSKLDIPGTIRICRHSQSVEGVLIIAPAKVFHCAQYEKGRCWLDNKPCKILIYQTSEERESEKFKKAILKHKLECMLDIKNCNAESPTTYDLELWSLLKED